MKISIQRIDTNERTISEMVPSALDNTMSCSSGKHSLLLTPRRCGITKFTMLSLLGILLTFLRPVDSSDGMNYRDADGCMSFYMGQKNHTNYTDKPSPPPQQSAPYGQAQKSKCINCEREASGDPYKRKDGSKGKCNTCCKGCALKQGWHSKKCEQIYANSKKASQSSTSKQSKRRPPLPPLYPNQGSKVSKCKNCSFVASRRGGEWDHCCQGCATGNGHSKYPDCGGVTHISNHQSNLAQTAFPYPRPLQQQPAPYMGNEQTQRLSRAPKRASRQAVWQVKVDDKGPWQRYAPWMNRKIENAYQKSLQTRKLHCCYIKNGGMEYKCDLSKGKDGAHFGMQVPVIRDCDDDPIEFADAQQFPIRRVVVSV